MATLIFDGACGVCAVAVDWVRNHLSRQPEMVPFQSIAPSDYGLTDLEVRQRVWLVSEGRIAGGHRAIAELFRGQPEPRWRFLGQLLLTPPVSMGARVVYAIVARNRHRIRIGQDRCEYTPLPLGANAQSGTRPATTPSRRTRASTQ